MAVIIDGGKNVMRNTGMTSLQVTANRFEAQFNIESPANLQGSQIVTKSGTGVIIPTDFVQ